MKKHSRRAVVVVLGGDLVRRCNIVWIDSKETQQLSWKIIVMVIITILNASDPGVNESTGPFIGEAQ